MRCPTACALFRYERSWPTSTNGTVQQTSYTDATAPVYIISAAPGNVEGLAPGHTQTTTSKQHASMMSYY